MAAIQRLEQAAIRAHTRGACWAEYFANYGNQIRAAEPYRRNAYHALVRRLLALVTSGNTDGMTAAGDDGTMPWVLDDDAAKPADVGTAARCLIPLLAIPGITTADTLRTTR